MKKTTSGFTIVELLIVIIVIAILAAISVVAFNGIRVRAIDQSRASAFNKTVKGLENFNIINNRYPGTDEIRGASGAALLGLKLVDVEPYGFWDPNNAGIEVGWTPNTGLVYMAYEGRNQTGFQCVTTSYPSGCKSYSLAHYSSAENRVVTRYGSQ